MILESSILNLSEKVAPRIETLTRYIERVDFKMANTRNFIGVYYGKCEI